MGVSFTYFSLLNNQRYNDDDIRHKNVLEEHKISVTLADYTDILQNISL